MARRELIQRLVAGESVERCGFWLGNPHSDTWPILHQYFGTATEEELRQKLNDDCRWICPQFYDNAYQDPQGRELFDASLDREKHTDHPLASCEDPAELDDFPWPDPAYLEFDQCVKDLETAGDVYRMSGFWTCFYHNIMDLLGMEEYLVKMYTHPEVVEAVTDRVCRFYYDANERFFAAAGDRVDAFFFGNDFGTQLGLICGPDQFRQFIMPWFKRFIRPGPSAWLSGDSSLLRCSARRDRGSDFCGRSVSAPITGQGGRHGRRNPGARLQGSDRIHGRNRYARSSD